jgi:hypothetical protein
MVPPRPPSFTAVTGQIAGCLPPGGARFRPRIAAMLYVDAGNPAVPPA